MTDVYLNQIESLNHQQLILISIPDIFNLKLIDFFISTKNSCKQYKNMYTMWIEYK